MANLEEAMANPFSREKAWLTYQENMTRAAALREEIRQGQADGSLSERELLFRAAEALGRLTDNTILARIVRGAVEARDKE